MRCSICNRLLENPADPLSIACGGDCWGCVGEIEAQMGYESSLSKVREEFARGLRRNWIEPQVEQGSGMRNIDDLIPTIEEIRAEGALIILKWDGERTQNTCTVAVSRQETDFVWRKDSNQIREALIEAIRDYKTHHAK